MYLKPQWALLSLVWLSWLSYNFSRCLCSQHSLDFVKFHQKWFCLIEVKMLGYLWGEGSFISDLAMGQRQQRQLDKDDDLSITPAIMGIVTLRIGCYPQTQKACLRGAKNSETLSFFYNIADGGKRCGRLSWCQYVAMSSYKKIIFKYQQATAGSFRQGACGED